MQQSMGSQRVGQNRATELNMCDQKYDINKPIYKTEIDSQTQRTDCGCHQGECWVREELGVWDQQMQTIILGWINNKVLLNGTGNYIYYPMINHTGK